MSLQAALKEVISRDSFCAPEIEIFRGVQTWSERNPDEALQGIVKHVRLPLMSLDELLNTVRPSSLVAADAILDAIKVKSESRDMDLNYRGFLSEFPTTNNTIFSIYKIIKHIVIVINSSNLQPCTIFRFSVPEENVASLRHNAQVVRGEMKASLLDGDCQNYDLDRGFTRHPIDDNHGQGIVVKMAMPGIINTIKMLLWDRDIR